MRAAGKGGTGDASSCVRKRLRAGGGRRGGAGGPAVPMGVLWGGGEQPDPRWG